MGLFRKQYQCLVCGKKFNSEDERESHVKLSHSEFDSETLEKPCKNCKDGIMKVMPYKEADLPAFISGYLSLVLCQKCGICEFYKKEYHLLDD